MNSESKLTDHFDCVVMLTWSNWHTEPRSNRYHYATRFSKHLPVIFVQPDLSQTEFRYERSEVSGLDILRIYNVYGPDQSRLLNRALLMRNLLKPLLWIYNPHFAEFIVERYAPLKIYHATEDYFARGFVDYDSTDHMRIMNDLRIVLKNIDLLIPVSQGVMDSYINNGNYMGRALLLTNGCDFEFWNAGELCGRAPEYSREQRNIIFYQGGINRRMDIDLLEHAVRMMPDFEFWFCGTVSLPDEQWSKLLRYENFKYWGNLACNKVKDMAKEATVGIIPFMQEDWIVDKHFPLKAFEYAAAGLPVVSTPINALKPYPEVFRFAPTAEQFSKEIRLAAEERYNESLLEKRLSIARKQDYNDRFSLLLREIGAVVSEKVRPDNRLNILFLFDDRSTHTRTVLDHLESFAFYSEARIFYAKAANNAECMWDLSLFDVVVIHYSIRLSLTWHISRSYVDSLRNYGGLKVLYIQDEYDTTETARSWIETLGIHVVFTCIPEKFIRNVYLLERFPYVRFIQVLTGYVPERLGSGPVKKLEKRRYVIGYRGRPLPYYYGTLGQEKIVIGQRMRRICEERGIPVNIEWEGEKRIYGDAWFDFLMDCRATLGTESGSNVFDDIGAIKHGIEEALRTNPQMTYQEAHEKFIRDHEGKVIMNQISPKVFEAIACRTALVLFEGTYSGVVEPYVHYIPLKKDFSNVDEVLEKLNDDAYLEELTGRAYNDIVASGKFSYKKFVQEFDELISSIVRRGNGKVILSCYSRMRMS